MRTYAYAYDGMVLQNIHIRRGLRVVGFELIGNAKASIRGTDNRVSSTLFVYMYLTAINLWQERLV